MVLNTGLGNGEVQEKIKELLNVGTPTASDDSGKFKLAIIISKVGKLASVFT